MSFRGICRLVTPVLAGINTNTEQAEAELTTARPEEGAGLRAAHLAAPRAGKSEAVNRLVGGAGVHRASASLQVGMGADKSNYGNNTNQIRFFCFHNVTV